MNPMEAAKRTNDLLFAILALALWRKNNAQPTAEEVDQFVVDALAAVKAPKKGK